MEAEPQADRWQSRPVLAGLTRITLLVVPIAVALLVVRVLHTRDE